MLLDLPNASASGNSWKYLWAKQITDALVYGWRRPIFLKSPKEKKYPLNISIACLFKKTDATKHFIIVYKSFLTVFTQE